MRHLVSRLLFTLGALAFSWSAFALVLLKGPLAPHSVHRTATAFVGDPIGRGILESSVTSAATAAGLDPLLTERVSSALFANEDFLPSVAWAITSRYTAALGEDPGTPPASVRPPDELLRDAARKAGAPRAVVERLSVTLPEPRIPFASYTRDRAQEMWWPLLRLSLFLLTLSAILHPALSVGLSRVGRLFISASFLYVALGVVAPHFLADSTSPTWSFLGLMLKSAASGITPLAVVAMGLGAALVILPPSFRRG